MLVRGGKLIHWVMRPAGDTVWSVGDWATAQTLEARWQAKGVSEEERRRLLPCAVWNAKWPGMSFTPSITSRLNELANS